MRDFSFADSGIAPADILLPSENVDLTKWATVACDQFTSQPDYWRRVFDFVGDAPSTVKITQPEIYLSDAPARIPFIHKTMREYVENGTLYKAVENGFILAERSTDSGKRIGLIANVDLEAYDYAPGSKPLIRATEGTIVERIPPRAQIRENAELETPHAMLLSDDPNGLLTESLYARYRDTAPLYDFGLMEGGGHLRGWRISDDSGRSRVLAALNELHDSCGGFMFAVGDGNHSLATAKACWDKLKLRLSDDERSRHPARYALAEIVSLHSPALTFEPIHRALFGADFSDLFAAFSSWLERAGMSLADGNDMRFIYNGREKSVSAINANGLLPVYVLQRFLDEYLSENPEIRIDYIHGSDDLKNLLCENDVGILLNAIDKNSFFESIKAGGALPRKTFSMGEAREKRYYMECRRILD